MRHLHRDYNTAHCGLDASHVLMTHTLSEADCPDCIAAHATYAADLEAAAAEEAAAELARQQADEVRLAERVAEIIARQANPD
jgi:hypothetical protein